ncbi:MAG: hypothetical protein QOE51_4545 [Actinoplanes sp.]|jgi:hypothetical protein|nr:hypothetical protein [Actinoplanes sp.]
MGVSVALSAESLDVVPGEETVCTLTARNTGSVIDQISVDVVGVAAAWSVVEPAVVNLYPGDIGEVRVHMKPPKASKPAAGKMKFGVRATSLEDPAGSATAEGTLNVAPFTELRVALLPQISRGSRRGKHKIDVSNLGNVPVSTQITAVDPDDALTFTVPRPAVAPAGKITQSRLVAVPRRKFWSGKQETKPFQVVVTPERGPASTVEGTFEQDPLVPRWALATAVAALALAVVLAGLWFTLVRPAVTSAATEAAKAEASKAAAANNSADDGGGQGSAGGASASPEPSADGSAKPTKKPEPGSAGNPLTAPTSFRILTDAAPGTAFHTFTSPNQANNKALDVTDLQLQNPAADSGYIEVRRGSQVVYRAGLDNFRDLPQAYVTPIRFAKGQLVTVAIQCLNKAPNTNRCSAAVTVVGKTA